MLSKLRLNFSSLRINMKAFRKSEQRRESVWIDRIGKVAITLSIYVQMLSISCHYIKTFQVLYLRTRGIPTRFFSSLSSAASMAFSFAKRACFSAPSAARAVWTRAVLMEVLKVSIDASVAGLLRAVLLLAVLLRAVLIDFDDRAESIRSVSILK